LFLREAVEHLGLSNVSVICERGEKVVLLREWREKFDVATARAVAKPDKVIPWALDFLKISDDSSPKGVLLMPGACWNISLSSHKGLPVIITEQKCNLEGRNKNSFRTLPVLVFRINY